MRMVRATSRRSSSRTVLPNEDSEEYKKLQEEHKLFLTKVYIGIFLISLVIAAIGLPVLIYQWKIIKAEMKGPASALDERNGIK